MDSVVYHSSPTQGLTEIQPNISTHGESWIYATTNKIVAALFLAREGGDYTLASGVIDGIPYLCERFKGAFDLVYANKKGSIYTLDAKNFVSGKTSFKAEVISAEKEKVLNEERIDDVKQYLLNLEKSGQLSIYYYPNRPEHIPADDRDLVDKTVNHVRQFGKERMRFLLKYHPDLAEIVLAELDN